MCSVYVPGCGRHLVHDAVEYIPIGHYRDAAFRIRVWRGLQPPYSDVLGQVVGPQEMVPVVLVSPAPIRGAIDDPTKFRTKIANYVKSAILCHSELGMLYFDYLFFPAGDVPSVSQVFFEYFGHQARLKLFRPIDKSVSAYTVASLVRGRVDW